ncbi:signal recognition particle-docking protein FtsY [Polyangium jinanense]|uniref:Signal recognition particle receptor FtsY n=1 Tax=Polyangium jinanense TaxID=2829994 RepID=A0A9X3X610_9BACT|nr:signal recognition particle-docking protein FtsY [Polyangium jinanense]MDC3959433.1 signal recognition particle-docking protein FtsY [Polyangium jinanense]MDC3984867.1 signal recognition particle-docking protein FtsY [Polyangium jinanense]
MDPLYIVIGLVVVALAVYFLFIRKPEAPKKLETPPEAKKLPATKAPEREEPAKTAGKPAKEEPKQAAPAKVKPAEEAKEAKKKEEKKAAEPAPAVVEKQPEPAPVAKEPEAKQPEPAPVQAPTPVAEPAPKPAEAPAIKPVSIAARELPAPSAPRKKDVEGLRRGLTKARESEGFFGRLKALFVGRSEVDPGLVDQIEEVLLTSDVGVKTTEALLEEIRAGIKEKKLVKDEHVWDALRRRARELLGGSGGGIKFPARPTVVMFVGVNGAGKTTTIGKLATKLKAEGRTVVLAAGDTFRAAAVQQLVVWGKRVGCEVVSGKDGANPGAVIYDAIQKAAEIGADVVLADTAGRLHTKTNLMDELTKVARTIDKALPGAPHETLLVLDATNGQNALQQAAMFKEALPLSGIVLTKLDGTAKGGVVLGICAEHALPVRYIGIGERPDELRDFNADEFVEALLGQTDESTDAAA